MGHLRGCLARKRVGPPFSIYSGASPLERIRLTGIKQKKDICPVCKSSRYLNPNMRFLVNPECYHKMCESCVDRIFSQGPAPCPVAGCARTLRKQRFRKATFDDLKIEREVDVRRRVAEAFSMQESDFETLLAYNNYLEEMEVITFNLLGNIDIAATERKLAAYAAQTATKQNPGKSNGIQPAQAAAREQARLNRDAARREDQSSRDERDEAHHEAISTLANSKKGDTETQKVVLKKSTARRTAAEKARDKQRQQELQQSKTPDNETFRIEGLKQVALPEPEKPFDPFGGLDTTPSYYTLQAGYDHPWLDGARTDPKITAGGYDVREYYHRVLTEAFAGLGCFIADEVGERESSGDAMVATEGAALAAGGAGNGDDVL